jgi:hypothetical protein
MKISSMETLNQKLIAQSGKVIRGTAADGEADEAVAYRDERTTVKLGPGDTRTITLETAFEPEQIVIDPDALVLMLNREQAVSKL